MKRKLSLCLAVTALLGAAGPKPRPKATAKPGKPGPSLAQPNPDLPLAGSCAEWLPPGTERARAVGVLANSLSDFQATVMTDGKVLVTGGSVTQADSQSYDPGSRRFSSGPAMTQPRQGHRALLLKDGRLLLVGGSEAQAGAELLEVGGARFQPLPGDARFGLCAEAVELEDGKVFLVDGGSGQCYLWDGKKSVRSAGSLNRPRQLFRATRLQDGRVLISGGWPSEQKPKGRARVSAPTTGPLPVEVFNPRWSTFSSWKAAAQVRARHQATLLEDGRVCLWAGYGADVTSACEAVELLDPAKETVTSAGRMDLAGLALPAWGNGLFLAEHSGSPRAGANPLALLTPATPGPARLANAYLAPTLVGLKDGSTLVLGTPAWGVPVDRWDPRSQQCSVVGSLRPGVQNLALGADGKVLVLGPVIDQLDPRSGALKPLGWREDLDALVRTAKPYQPAARELPPFPPGQARKDYLVVALDKGRALVLGGVPVTGGEPSGAVELWDQKKKTLTPLAAMKNHRAFPAQTSEPQGALKLADGSVLIWGPGKPE